MAGRRRRASVAYLPAERDAWLRVAYLEHYADDPGFAGELTTLYVERAEPARPLPFSPAEWWIGATSDRPEARELFGVSDAAAAYVAGVRQLAGRYGLPRLRAPEGWLWAPLTVGEWLVHSWCSERATEAVHGRRVDAEWFPCGYGIGLAFPDVPAGAFDPRRELYGEARNRLGWRHRDALEATAGAGEAAGYVFMDNAPELRRDLGWLFRHVAHGEAFDAIAAADLPSDPDGTGPETVRRAVRRMARRVLAGR